MEENGIEPYDIWADTIICSKDYELCVNKDDYGNCLLDVPNYSRCWHITKCPAGYKRDIPIERR